MAPFALQQARCSSALAVAGRPPRSLPPPLVVGVRRRPSSSSSGGGLPLLLLTRPAAFGLGGGGNSNKNGKPSSPVSAGDAMASAAAEAEAAAAKVGEAAASASEAAEALAAQVAEEAAEAGAAGGASSALAPAAAPAAAASAPAAAASSSSLPPAPVRSAAAGRGAQARSVKGKKDGILSLLPQLGRQPAAAARRPTTLAGRRARGLARALLLAGVAYALLSLGAAVMKVARRANSPRARRLRTVDRNKRVVEALNEVFLSTTDSSSASSSSSSSSSASLTPALMKKLRAETGFTGPEIFRKYLWYLLRERRFDSTAVADLVKLRGALALTDAEVASAIKERAQRIYDKYGNVMLDVAGMSKAGIERKATCRALFSKLLFLSEAEELFPENSAAATAMIDVPGVFGATDDDAAKLRIVSLLEVDLGKLEEQFPNSEGGAGGGGGGFFGDQPADDGGSGGGGNGGGGGGGW